jgi:hypothetical protein
MRVFRLFVAKGYPREVRTLISSSLGPAEIQRSLYGVRLAQMDLELAGLEKTVAANRS